MKVLWLLTRIGFYLFVGGLFFCLPIESIFMFTNKITSEPRVTPSFIFSGMFLILVGLNPWYPLPTAKPYYQSRTVWAICWCLLMVALVFGIPYYALDMKALLPYAVVPIFICVPFAIWEAEASRRAVKKHPKSHNV